jgi:MoaA/NifB/PqqE/SkfB family radical SAM enzyme
MYPYESVRQLHLELTTRCNASCPQCPRNIDGGAVNPNLPLTELSLDDCRQMFPPEFLQQLRDINFCGNYGDPSLANDLLAVCEYIRSVAPQARFTVRTNGGTRTPEWWTRLAGLVDECIFGIDGLQDTNHLYRRNTVWSHIMANATAFIQAGGNAGWDFLVFEHNEHQVHEAAVLARRMGFRGFYPKRTGRFLKDNTLLESVPVRNQKGELVQILRPPTGKRLQNPTSKIIASKYGTAETFETYLKTTSITCYAQAERDIFVSAEGLVLPCCWVAQLYPVGAMSERKRQIHTLIAALPQGRDSIDAHLHSIRDIVATSLFQSDIPSGWNAGDSRLRVCAKFCGQHGVSQQQAVAPPLTVKRVLAAGVRRLSSMSARLRD